MSYFGVFVKTRRLSMKNSWRRGEAGAIFVIQTKKIDYGKDRRKHPGESGEHGFLPGRG